MSTTADERTLTKTQLEAFRTKVKEALWEYEELGNELRDKVIEYLITGEDATCLLEMPAAYQNKDRKQFFKGRGSSAEAKNKAAQKKLAGLFRVTKATPGYYKRLAEVAGQVPELAQVPVEGDNRTPEWLTNLFKLRRILHQESWYYTRQADPNFKMAPIWPDVVEEVEVATMLEVLLDYGSSTYTHISRYMIEATDWPSILEQYPAELSQALKAIKAGSREEALQWLRTNDFKFDSIMDTVAEFAVSSSKKVRPLAIAILRTSTKASVGHLEKFLGDGSAGERGFAAEALAIIQGAKAEATLKTALETETAPRVRQTIEGLLAGFAPSSKSDDPQSEVTFDLRPIEMPTGELPLPQEFKDALWEQFQQSFEQQERQYKQQVEAYAKPDKPYWMSKPEPVKRIDRKEFDRYMDYVEGTTNKKPSLPRNVQQAVHSLNNWAKWTDLTKIHLVHIVRMLDRFQLFHVRDHDHIHIHHEDWIEGHRSAQPAPYGLREVDAAFTTVRDVKPATVAKTYLNSGSWNRFFRWEPEAVWPLFAEYLDLFRDAILGVSDSRQHYWDNDRRRNAIEVAGMMPKLPPEIEASLLSVALGEGKTDRPAARKAVLDSPQALSRALTALTDGKQAIRIAAAEMLAALGDDSAIKPLKEALKKEKQDLVQGSLLQAIEKLGGSVDEFLGHDKLLDDAKKGLKKKRPKGMEWVPLDTLPSVRWAETNDPVPTEILQWWVIQSIQFKLPVCGAVLRRSMQMCRTDDAGAFAKYLLASWIAYDTKSPTRDEVLEAATKEAASHWKSGANSPLKNGLLARITDEVFI